MSYLIYDIETYMSSDAELYWSEKDIKPDSRLKDPEKIEADIAKKRLAGLERSALSPITGRVTCVGVSFNGDFQFFINMDERAVLQDLNTYIEGKDILHYVGFNSLDFDLGFLRARHFANKMQLPVWLRPSQARAHVDVMKMFGYKNFYSLADFEFIMGLHRDTKKDGRMALKFWEEEDWASLEKYSLDDIRSTEAMYLMAEPQ